MLEMCLRKTKDRLFFSDSQINQTLFQMPFKKCDEKVTRI